MNTVVAVSKVGIISTPNHPMYKRLLVDVMNPAKRDHVDSAPDFRIQIEEVIYLKSMGMHKWVLFVACTSSMTPFDS